MLVDNPLISDKRVEKEAHALLNVGFEILILAMSEPGLEEEFLLESVISVKRVISPEIKKPLSLNYAQTVKYVAQIIIETEAGIVYCHDYLTIPIGAYVKRSNPTLKLIYDCHEYLRGWPLYKELPTLLTKIKGYLVWKYMLYLEKKGFKACDGVVCTSALIAERIASDHHLSSFPTVVQNIPNQDPVAPIDVKSMLKIDRTAFLVVHAGTMYFSQEELKYTLNIFEQDPNAHLLLVGNRPSFYALKDACQGSFTSIHFIEYHHYHLMNLLAGCDAGLVHLRSDLYLNHNLASSNKFMEYIRAAIPIISAEQTMHRRLNQPLSFTAFYNNHDPDSFRLALQAVQLNAVSWKSNVQSVNRLLEWKDEANKLINLVKSTCESSN